MNKQQLIKGSTNQNGIGFDSNKHVRPSAWHQMRKHVNPAKNKPAKI